MSDFLQIDRLVSSIVTGEVRRIGGAQLTDALRHLVQKVEGQARDGVKAAAYKKGKEAGLEEGHRLGQAATASPAPPPLRSTASQTDTITPDPTQPSAMHCSHQLPPLCHVLCRPVPPKLSRLMFLFSRSTGAFPLTLPPHPHLLPATSPHFRRVTHTCSEAWGAASIGLSRPRSSCAPRLNQQNIVFHIYSSHPSDSTSSHTQIPSSTSFHPSMRASFDWDRDPRLRDLGRALTVSPGMRFFCFCVLFFLS
ncbi:hypothetical protein B0H10DRAFT_1108374 [Mycena sp. CBHHK59/15]|nr:hypothetical protein B0H10DRAFT_1108374 [Mycena sp. CBHHK59/15]